MPNELRPMVKVESFKGLNNRADPIRLGLEWQLQADNCLCDDAGFLIRRPGQQLLASGFKDAHGTRAGRLLAIDGGDNLVRIDEQGIATVLRTGIVGAPFQWVELGYGLFLMSSNYRWAIYPDRAMEWGSLCPTPPPTDAYPAVEGISYPPPFGNVLGTRRDQLAVAAWEDEHDRSVLYFSLPGKPHEFQLARDYLLFAGRITLLAETAQGLVIGTDRAIFVDFVDAPVTRVAEYGAMSGGLAYSDKDLAVFWTERGLCRVPPFENITDKAISVTNRKRTTAAVLAFNGSEYAVVHSRGVVRRQRRTRPHEPMPVANTHSQP